MRAGSFICKLLMWCSIVFYTMIQALTVFGLTSNNLKAVKAGQLDSVYGIGPLVTATLMMLIAVILFTIIKKRKFIGIVIAAVAAALMLVVALDLGRTFSSSIGTGGIDVGLSTWKLVWRHIGMAIIPALMLFAWLFQRCADKADEQFMKDKKGYDLSGQAIFTDTEDVEEKCIKPRRPKRSVRKRIE